MGYRYQLHTFIWGTILLFFLSGCASIPKKETRAKGKQSYSAYAVAFYNVENLFDTEDDPENKGDNEFLPTGPYNWTEKKYQKKLDNLALVLSRLGREHTPVGPAVIGLAEVENRRVLEDLVARPQIADMGLDIVHVSSPDKRGIETALLYNPTLFKVESYRAYPYPIIDSLPHYRTRDQLLVSGILAGERFHVIVCHWPSRYGGAKSSILREKAAEVTRHIVDSLITVDPRSKIVVMGDLNDDPNNKSVAEVLNAKEFKKDVLQPNDLLNVTWKPFGKGIGTLVYQNKWNLFDQLIISQSLISDKYETLGYWKLDIFNRPFLHTKEGKRKGYPHRTFEGSSFINGYSDHFPVVLYLLKKRP